MFRKWIVLLLLLSSVGFFLGLPLLQPRGLFGWGYYRLIDIFLGIPLAIVTIEFLLVLCCRQRYRRALAIRIGTVTVVILVTGLAFDLGYAMVVRNAWRVDRTDAWFDDEGSVSRVHNLPDQELGFVRKPGLSWKGAPHPGAEPVEYRTDENGFRNPRGISRADVVFIGDSFTEGASVPEDATFVNLTGARTGMQVVNLGRGQYGPRQELLVLKRYGLAYKPKVVVLQVFEGNDLGDARCYAKWHDGPYVPESLKLRYAKNSLLVDLIRTTRGNQLEEIQFRSLRLPGGGLVSIHLDYTYIPDQPERESFGFSETKRVIQELVAFCESKGIKLVIIFVPIKVRVLGPYVNFESDIDRDKWLPGGRCESNGDFGDELDRFARSIKCPFIDCYPALKQAAVRDRGLYMMGNDSHLNVGGHRVVGGLVASWLELDVLKNQDK